MAYSILASLDESKIKKKTKIYVEYSIKFTDSTHTFLVERDNAQAFEDKFNESQINDYEQFAKAFPEIVTQLQIA